MKANGNLKVLHTSDLHLGDGAWQPDSARRDPIAPLEAVVDLALESQVDLVIVAGDFFDNNRIHADLIDSVYVQIGRLTMPLVVLPGNHDCLVPESVYNRIDFTRTSPNVHVFRNIDGESMVFPEMDLSLWGKPLAEYGGGLRPIEVVPPKGRERWNIIVAHGHFVNGDNNLRYSFPITKEDIAQTGRDYIALGHWAHFDCIARSPVTAIYSGSPTLTNKAVIVDLVAETGEVRTTQHPFASPL